MQGRFLKKKIVWLAVSRSTYNDFLFEEVAKEYDLVVVYRANAQRTHPWQFEKPGYQAISANSNFLKIYQYCKQSDLLVMSGWGFWFYLLLTILCHNRRRVYWTDTIPIRNYFYGLKGVLRRLVSRYVFNSFTQVWSTGQPGCEALRKAGCPEQKIRNFPYFVNIIRSGNQDNKIKIASLNFRQAHVPAEGVTVFLGIGQFILRKRYGDILNAMAKLNNEKAVFWLAGAGPKEKTLRRQAKQLGIDSHVFFLGWVQPQDMDIVCQACDVFVHPAEFEAFGVVVLDAMAMAKPVIGSRTSGAVVDRIQNGVNGFVTDPGNIDGIADAMKYFLDNPTSITQYGGKARETAEKYPVELGLSLLDNVFKLKK